MSIAYLGKVTGKEEGRPRFSLEIGKSGKKEIFEPTGGRPLVTSGGSGSSAWWMARHMKCAQEILAKLH